MSKIETLRKKYFPMKLNSKIRSLVATSRKKKKEEEDKKVRAGEI